MSIDGNYKDSVGSHNPNFITSNHYISLIPEFPKKKKEKYWKIGSNFIKKKNMVTLYVFYTIL